MQMKDGAICANAGHFDCEVSRADLERICTKKYEARKNIEGYVLPNGKTVFLMAEGRLVNLAAGDGHPAEIMDLSFAMQTLAVWYLLGHGRDMKFFDILSINHDILVFHNGIVPKNCCISDKC